MSFVPQDPRSRVAYGAGPDGLQDGLRQGSVRAARERLYAGQREQGATSWGQQPPTTNSIPPQYTMPDSSIRPWESSQYPSSPRNRTFADEYESSRSPIQPQWPLPDSRYVSAGPHPVARQYAEGPSLVSVPMPVPAPRNPPAFQDRAINASSSNTLLQKPSYDNRSSDQNNVSYTPSQYTTGQTGSSMSLDNSSDSLPSFPLPDYPLPASQFQAGQRNMNTGPPPISRRGPSSYYSGISYGVSPIPEESETRGSVKSYASSSVMPSRVPEFFLDESPSDDEDESAVDFDFRKADEERMVSSRLVRQASIGKRGKPALTTIKSTDNVRTAVASSAPMSEALRPNLNNATRASIMSGQSVLLDASSSDQSRGQSNDMDTHEPFRPADGYNQENPRFTGKNAPIERGSVSDLRQSRVEGLSDRVGKRRPASLNVEAVRQAEARGSLTSLPDLIKRATQLAANLDRGKTASRLGMDWMLDGEKFTQRQRLGNLQRTSGHSSISGILASFPPPGPVTPMGNLTPGGNWPSMATSQKSLDSQKARDKNPNTRGRRICGLSVKAFVICAIVILLLVAAAVVLPVVLIVLPNREKAASYSTSALQKCIADSPCQNGGSNILNSDGSCGCVCTNGFTGTLCQTQANAGCTTLDIADTNGATVGTQVPSLISAAQQTYNIPLSAAQLSSVFSSSNLTCTTENALITFTGSSSQKRKGKRHNYDAETSDLVQRGDDTRRFLQKRDDNPTTTLTSSTTAATIATTSSAPVSIGTGNAAPGTNSTAQDFAKVAILFVLQDSSSLPAAVKAQEQLLEFFDSAKKLGTTVQLAQNVSLGLGYSIDLWDWTFTARNQSIFGHGASNINGSISSTKRSLQPPGWSNRSPSRVARSLL